MDRVMTLAEIVQREVEAYNEGGTYRAVTHAISDIQKQIYSVVIVPDDAHQRPAWVVVMARVVGDKVVIIEDTTDKPLYEALMINAKIPREQIILEYAGEKLPHPKAD